VLGAAQTNAQTPHRRPHVLLFDLGGVLVENVGFERLNALLPTPSPIEDLKTRWLASSAVRSFEVGACSSESFAVALLKEWQIALTPNEFIEAFSSWPKGLYPGAAELLSRLRGRYRLGFLQLESHSLGALRQLPWAVEIRLPSHLLGEVKPDPACFERACKNAA